MHHREHVEHAVPVVALRDRRRPQLVHERLAGRRGQPDDCWATPFAWLLSYAPYLVAYVSVCHGSALKKLWSIMMFITQRMVSGPAAFTVWPVNDDWSPITPLPSIAFGKKARPAATALFQNEALAVSKQAHA